GFSPLSISLTEDPIALTVYVADVWSNAPTPAGWQAGVARTEEQLQQELMRLPPPLVPTYLKAYTVGMKLYLTSPPRSRSSMCTWSDLPPPPPLPTASSLPTLAAAKHTLLAPSPLLSLFLPSHPPPPTKQVFYAYVARPPSAPTAPHRILTPNIGRSGFELLALSLKHPPLLVSSFLPPKCGSHGKSERERYSAVWQTDGAEGGVGEEGGIEEWGTKEEGRWTDGRANP
ncbi:unnamed protein product, partial [Closterium sp. NIES-54]